MIISNRDVAKKAVSKSFKGILRVSPDINDTDTGIPSGESGTMVKITDSIGNATTIEVNTDKTKIGNVTLTGETTIENLKTNNLSVNNVNYPSEAPAANEILIGENNNFILKNLYNILEQYRQETTDTVPTGTIISALRKYEPLDPNDPSQTRKAYLFLNGQTVSKSLYENLYNILKDVIDLQETTNDFTLPDIEGEHRYLMPTSNILKTNPKIEESLPNIKGNFNASALYVPVVSFPEGNGAFFSPSAEDPETINKEWAAPYGGFGGNITGIGFDASKMENSVYKDDAAVRPKSFSVRLLIKT